MKSCPKCKSNMIIDIIYGFPTKKMLEDASYNKINLGGCDISPNNPDFKCKSCGYEFKELDKFFNRTDKIDSLFNEISKLNLGSVTDVSDQWVCINIKGNKVFDLLSNGSPFDFREFKNNKNHVVQTLLNHIDVTIHHKELNEINLFVRRSFSEHLMLWLNDSARFI